MKITYEEIPNSSKQFEKFDYNSLGLIFIVSGVFGVLSQLDQF